MNKKRSAVRARLVIGEEWSLVKKLDDPDATLEMIASTAKDAIERARDEGGERILKISEVVRMIGFSKSEIYRRLDNGGDIPRPIDLGGRGPRRRVGWRLSEIRSWLRARPRT